MAGPFGEQCRKCAAFDPLTSYCRKNPPTPGPADSSKGEWPITHPSSWCLTGFQLHPDHDPNTGRSQQTAGTLRTW